jgi:methionyl aminopeptidase
MAIITDKQELENLRYSCRILMSAFEHAGKMVVAGKSCGEINQFVTEFVRSYGGEPSFLNYGSGGMGPFKYAVCISINDEVVHGIAPFDKIIPNNSLVKLDMGVNYKGSFSDSAKTYIVGTVSDEAKKLVEVCEASLQKGMNAVKAGAKVGDIGFAINEYVKQFGFGNVEELGGHGVGRAVHEPPFIPHIGKKGKGSTLMENQVICIEPMLTLGSSEVSFDETKADGWTVRTKDGNLAAHFEHEILITKKGFEILTEISQDQILPIIK